MKRDAHAFRRDESWARISELQEIGQRMINQEHAYSEFALRVVRLEDSHSTEQIEQTIEPGLGKMMISGDGEIVGIRLDVKALRISNKDILGERILAALSAARVQASAKHAEDLKRIVKLLKTW